MDNKEEVVTVIRIVQYKGSADAVRKAIQLSQPLGIRDCRGYTLTIAEHSSTLPPAIELDASKVNDALSNHCPVFDPCDDCRKAEGLDELAPFETSGYCSGCGSSDCNGQCMEIP